MRLTEVVKVIESMDAPEADVAGIPCEVFAGELIDKLQAKFSSAPANEFERMSKNHRDRLWREKKIRVVEQILESRSGMPLEEVGRVIVDVLGNMDDD